MTLQFVTTKRPPKPKVGRRAVRQWQWFWLGLLLVGIVGGAHIIVELRRNSSPEKDLTALTVPVTVQDFTLRIEASGSIEPISSVNISPKMTGRLMALYVDQGDRVQTGQTLAQMDVGTLEAEMAQARAQLAQREAEYARVRNGNRQEAVSRAQAQVAAAQAEADLSAKRLERYRMLAQEGAIARNDLDQYISEDRSTRASLKEKQEQLLEQQSGSRYEDVAQAAAPSHCCPCRHPADSDPTR